MTVLANIVAVVVLVSIAVAAVSLAALAYQAAF